MKIEILKEESKKVIPDFKEGDFFVVISKHDNNIEEKGDIYLYAKYVLICLQDAERSLGFYEDDEDEEDDIKDFIKEKLEKGFWEKVEDNILIKINEKE